MAPKATNRAGKAASVAKLARAKQEEIRTN